MAGTGPVVLWHTGGCGYGRMWELGGYIDGVPGFTHVLMDHRGHGRSEAPLDLEGHDMRRYVADVLAAFLAGEAKLTKEEEHPTVVEMVEPLEALVGMDTHLYVSYKLETRVF